MSRLPVASSSAASTGSSEAATVSDGMSTDCCVCLEDIYNDKDVAALIPCGHIFHEGCIKQALRAQMHNNGLYHILRTHLNTPSPTETGTFLRGELVSPEGRCLLCRTSVQGVMKVYLPKPRLAAKVEEKFKKIREGMAQLRQKVYSSAIRIIKLKRDKERLRKQRGQLLDELEDVMDELDEIKKENELIILDCRPCQQNTPENKTTRTTSGGMAPNTD